MVTQRKEEAPWDSIYSEQFRRLHAKEKKMLKTLRRRNQAFKNYKELVFLLPVYLIQHP